MIETSTEGYYWPGAFVARVVNTVVGIVELILLVRFVLELLGANAASTFVAWVYSASDALLGPFAGAFPGVYLTPNMVLDVVAIVAMVVYALVGWLIIELLAFVFSAFGRV
jgi:YggT family protein